VVTAACLAVAPAIIRARCSGLGWAVSLVAGVWPM